MKQNRVVYVDSDLEDLIPEFLSNRHNDVIVIKKLLKEDNLAEIQTLGHSMKGCGGGYGFDEITEIGKGIEEAAKKSDKVEIAKLSDLLAGYLSSVEVVYQNEE